MVELLDKDINERGELMNIDIVKNINIRLASIDDVDRILDSS